MSGPSHELHTLFLQGIHDASADLPLSLVLAGLGDTWSAAHEMGMTHGTTIHEIGGLCARDCATLMWGFCLHFGIDPAGHETRLAAPCEGWPRQLHFAMQALSEETLRCGGDLSRVDWAAAEASAAESRMRYCGDQKSDEMKRSAVLTAAVLGKQARETIPK